ncbi:MAG TPA: hypothetical protein VGM22_18010 [Methylomirabilota bacterium]|jgi:hypothetical protein
MSLRGNVLRAASLGLLVTLLVSGCGTLADSDPSLYYASPPLHHAPGGGHVRGDTSYHGSGGP